MNYQKFLSRQPRKGTPEDRGSVIPWPNIYSQPHKEGDAPPPVQRGALAQLLPGLVSGAADVDPALVLTATVAGAAFGYSTLWVVVLCVPFLLTVFTVAARIGYQTRRGLVDLICDNYGKGFALSLAGLIVVINMAMIFADLMAVSDAMSIILDQERIFFIAFIAFLVWYILIFRDYHRITSTLAILALPLFAYVISAVMSHPPVGEVVKSALWPQLHAGPDYTEAVIGLFGSLLTPYLLVWQTTSRREGVAAGYSFQVAEHRTGTVVTTVLCFSIIVAAGTVLRGVAFSNLTTRIAARALEPAVGDIGAVLFAIGIIGAGMVALPVLVASLCYSVSEALGWRYGLSEHPWEAKRFYMLISVALFVAGAMSYIHMNPVKALYWSQVLAGILTIPILLFILLLSNDRRVMQTVNSRWQNFWLGAAAGGLSSATLLLFWWKARH